MRKPLLRQAPSTRLEVVDGLVVSELYMAVEMKIVGGNTVRHTSVVEYRENGL
jgi:hypothetical protein